MTPEEYLAFERAVPEKHEYFQGGVFAMAGASYEHNLIVANLIRELGNALRDRPCRVFPSDMKAKLGDSYGYSDVLVLCGRPRFVDDKRDVLTNPTVVIEVLSDSTESFDRGAKFERYRALKSVTDYVLVSSSHVLVEHFARQAGGAWLLREGKAGGRVELSGVGAGIAVDEVYAKVWEKDAAAPVS
jgi:Uma2 family endonuclease